MKIAPLASVTCVTEEFLFPSPVSTRQLFSSESQQQFLRLTSDLSPLVHFFFMILIMQIAAIKQHCSLKRLQLHTGLAAWSPNKNADTDNGYLHPEWPVVSYLPAWWHFWPDQLHTARKSGKINDMETKWNMTITHSFLIKKYGNILDMPVHEQIRSLNKPRESANKSTPHHVKS